jgi:hypothetical protein
MPVASAAVFFRNAAGIVSCETGQLAPKSTCTLPTEIHWPLSRRRDKMRCNIVRTNVEIESLFLGRIAYNIRGYF